MIEHLVGHAHGRLVHVHGANEHEVVGVGYGRWNTVRIGIAAVQRDLASFALHRAENRREVLFRMRQIHLVENAHVRFARVLRRPNQKTQEFLRGIPVLAQRIYVAEKRRWIVPARLCWNRADVVARPAVRAGQGLGVLDRELGLSGARKAGKHSEVPPFVRPEAEVERFHDAPFEDEPFALQDGIEVGSNSVQKHRTPSGGTRSARR